jgi:hypothetical protein
MVLAYGHSARLCEAAVTVQRPLVEVAATACFVQRCRVCGKEIVTPWGPDVHEESRFALRSHLESHSDSAFAAYGRQEAYRGLS